MPDPVHPTHDRPTDRRQALLGLAASTAGAAGLLAGAPARADEPRAVATGRLDALMAVLARTPRRRDFKTVPMMLDDPALWDAKALDAVMAYQGASKQVWDNTQLDGPWMNLMRNALNTQVISFRHPDFLAVSATHGGAHLALFDQTMWDKYLLSKLAGAKFPVNTLAVAKPGTLDAAAQGKSKGALGPEGDTIPALQARGVVFLACHNAIWEQSARLIKMGVNPDRLSHEAMAAELTNHLVDGVVLTPGIVATIPELQRAGFGYIK
ncbi:thiosulfate dehydrogenase [Acidomonas methanolica]|uniref:thiosulfate dehydrogenase n=1 Tax=Acidomonas methanolica TaxID=437 RepID=UPI002119FAE2|nr:transcriptional initiation protein Tat [Acidomonas methanolica]MCQ9154196.1 transcriptional initiation protein Tat [Acidomonas methanolica]